MMAARRTGRHVSSERCWLSILLGVEVTSQARLGAGRTGQQSRSDELDDPISRVSKSSRQDLSDRQPTLPDDAHRQQQLMTKEKKKRRWVSPTTQVKKQKPPFPPISLSPSSLKNLLHSTPITLNPPLPIPTLLLQPPHLLALTGHLLKELRLPLLTMALTHFLP